MSRPSHTVANRVPGVFERLVGLETEYAVRFHSVDPSTPRPSRFRLYEILVDALGRRIPTAKAKHFKEGVFVANGGAVWFEAERPSAGGGLIEGATPECRGPREALAYQRAQDRLLAEAAEASRVSGEVCLIKNDRDSRDNVYGAQENYEAVLAKGFRLWVWRAGLALLFPWTVITWLGILLCVLATLAYFSAAALFYLLVRGASTQPQNLALLLFGRDLAEGRETCIHVPVWLESTLQVITRVVTAPLAASLYLLLQLTAFCHLRHPLLPFLVSRSIITGAGLVDSEGRFQLSDKGPAINCVLGFGGMFKDRPIFTMGHFLKSIYAEAWFSPREYFRLFTARQRLQIGLGDSNMCETAEYLRVGMTLLVLDAIEAGMLDDHPRIQSPIRALHAICRDATLKHAVALRGDGPATALQIQQYYQNVCREYLEQQKDAPPEAWEVLDRWNQVLRELEELAEGGKSPVHLIGRVDWVTKKFLLDQAAAEATWHERKKIDIRYHELSPNGYFEMLKSTGTVPRIVGDDELQRALRNPPADSPATTRGHYIREFADGGERLAVNWKTVTIGQGWRAKVIRLDQYRRGCRQRPRSQRSQPRNLDTGHTGP
ncbi:MAG: proteasome accessory factor PafA2 family protein [Pirellulales bacterium]